MGACLDENIAAELIDGVLAPAERRALEAHIDVCDSCRRLVARASEVARGAGDEASRSAIDFEADTQDDGFHMGRIIAQRYELIRELGRGGMGAVWQGRDRTLDRTVAVKMLSAARAAGDTALRRFKREAKAAANLRSPHIVEVYDYGVDNRQPFIVMEQLSGQDLRDRLRHGGPMGIESIAHIVVQVAKALDVAHAAGIVHRDLKPANVFMTSHHGETIVKVIDFGVAKAPPAPDSRAPSDTTAEGTVLGTPRYMSPEQTHGTLQVDHRSDLWALAIIVYTALTGRYPFEADGVGEMIARILHDEVTPPSTLVDGVNEDLDAFFEKALAKDPKDRFQSAAALAAELCRIANVTGPVMQRVAIVHGAGDAHADTAADLTQDVATRSVVPSTSRRSRWGAPLVIATMSAGAAIWVTAVWPIQRAVAEHTGGQCRRPTAGTEPRDRVDRKRRHDSAGKRRSDIIGRRHARARCDTAGTEACMVEAAFAVLEIGAAAIGSTAFHSTAFDWASQVKNRRRIVRHATLMRLLIVMFFVSVAASAFADDAKALFERARTLMTEGRHAEACPLLERSMELDPGVGTQFNLASCYEQVGRLAAALTHYRQVAETTTRAGQSERAEAVAQRIAALVPRVPHLRIDTRGAADGVVVALDEKVLSAEVLAAAIAVEPGEHTISASAPGREPWSGSVVVDVGETLGVPIPELRPIAPRAEPPPEPRALPAGSSEEPVAEPSSGAHATTGIVIGALGLVGLAVGAVLGGLAIGRKSDADSACQETLVCDPAGREAIESAQDFAAGSTVALIAGSALVVGGAVTWLTAPSVGSPGAALIMGGRF